MYCEASRPSILFAIHNPVVTAGFMWPPEMFIVAETMIAIPTPCARATMSEVTAPAFGPAGAGGTTPPPPPETDKNGPADPAGGGRGGGGKPAGDPGGGGGASTGGASTPPPTTRAVL